MVTEKRVTNLLVTGRPGVGKTTLVEQTVNNLNLPVGGFYTRELREGNQRVGFQLITWAGQKGIMSHIRSNSPFRVGKYGVEIAVIDKIGVPAIQTALKKDNLIVIDELGRMELFSDKFQKMVWKALESKTPLLGVIQERPHPFLNRVRKRPDVELLEVTPDNRNDLSKKLIGRLARFYKRPLV